MNKPARLSDSRNSNDFTQFTNLKPSTPTLLSDRREKKRGEFEGEKKMNPCKKPAAIWP
jgi:hypothetical protein